MRTIVNVQLSVISREADNVRSGIQSRHAQQVGPHFILSKLISE
jgi:hypothetical protein